MPMPPSVVALPPRPTRMLPRAALERRRGSAGRCRSIRAQRIALRRLQPPQPGGLAHLDDRQLLRLDPRVARLDLAPERIARRASESTRRRAPRTALRQTLRRHRRSARRAAPPPDRPSASPRAMASAAASRGDRTFEFVRRDEDFHGQGERSFDRRAGARAEVAAHHVVQTASQQFASAKSDCGSRRWHRLACARSATGEVAERSNAPVLKTGEPQGSVGSNPTLSATHRHRMPPSSFAPHRFSIRRKVLLGFGLLLAMLAVIALIAWRSTRTFSRAAEQRGARARRAGSAGSRRTAHLMEMESARRGFLISGDARFSGTMREAKQQLLRRLELTRGCSLMMPQAGAARRAVRATC